MTKKQFFQIITPQLLLSLPTGEFRLKNILKAPQAHCGPWFWDFINNQGYQYNIRYISYQDCNVYEKY